MNPCTPLCAVSVAFAKYNTVLLSTADTSISSVPNLSISPCSISVVKEVPDPVTFEAFAAFVKVPVSALPKRVVLLPSPES